jgi:tRNA threonylcarbamoyladenosine biosynthesis protein TsaE
MDQFTSHSAQKTKEFAAKIAKESQKPLVICLYGDLGSGKTVFSKGFALGLGIPEKQIKSPTYTFVRSYKIDGSARKAPKTLFHFDFYRISEADDLMAQDLEEIFEKKNTHIIIEWPERVQKLLPQERLDIYFEYKDENTRLLKLKNHYKKT